MSLTESRLTIRAMESSSSPLGAPQQPHQTLKQVGRNDRKNRGGKSAGAEWEGIAHEKRGVAHFGSPLNANAPVFKTNSGSKEMPLERNAEQARQGKGSFGGVGSALQNSSSQLPQSTFQFGSVGLSDATTPPIIGVSYDLPRLSTGNEGPASISTLQAGAPLGEEEQLDNGLGFRVEAENAVHPKGRPMAQPTHPSELQLGPEGFLTGGGERSKDSVPATPAPQPDNSQLPSSMASSAEANRITSPKGFRASASGDQVQPPLARDPQEVKEGSGANRKTWGNNSGGAGRERNSHERGAALQTISGSEIPSAQTSVGARSRKGSFGGGGSALQNSSKLPQTSTQLGAVGPSVSTPTPRAMSSVPEDFPELSNATASKAAARRKSARRGSDHYSADQAYIPLPSKSEELTQRSPVDSVASEQAGEGRDRRRNFNSYKQPVYREGRKGGDRQGYEQRNGPGPGGWREGRPKSPGRAANDPIEALGRLMTRILRHQAANLNLKMSSDGYVDTEDILKLSMKTFANRPLSSHSISDVKLAVQQDKKQRFGMKEENGRLFMRANQGHTLESVKTEHLLKPILAAEDIPVCVHGTYLEVLDQIFEEGLNRMNRNHIHFATGDRSSKGVISGMRNTCDVLIHLNVEKALTDGMKLYISENNVILTEGFDGVVPTQYFKAVFHLPDMNPIPIPSATA